MTTTALIAIVDDDRSVREALTALPGHGEASHYFRGDAAFANPEIYAFLEAEGAGYTILVVETRAPRHIYRGARLDRAE